MDRIYFLPIGKGAGININPVEGLKLGIGVAGQLLHDAGININPVEGLKLQGLLAYARRLDQPESTSTQSRV